MWLYAASVLAVLYLLQHWRWKRETVPKLSEKFVLITGCDSGFGNLLARQLDKRGVRVLAACLTQLGATRLQEVTSPRLQTVLLDVTSSESIAAATTWVKERVGNQGLWGLVNNAGVCMPAAPNEWLTKEDFLKVLNVNLLGLIDVTLHFLPLVRQAQGRVVNVASVMGRVAFFSGGYCMSKFAVEAFSDTLRREMRPFGVRVSIIEPGGFRTNFLQPEEVLKDLERIWERLPPEVQAAYGHRYLEKYAKSGVLLHYLSSFRLSHVTNAMSHALLSQHPRTRYPAGWDARPVLFFSHFPSWVLDTAIGFFLPTPARGTPPSS